MSSTEEVRYTSRSVTPPPRRHRRSKSLPRSRSRSRSRIQGSGDAYNPTIDLYTSRSVTPPPNRGSRSRSPSRSRGRSCSRSQGSGDAYNPGNNLYTSRSVTPPPRRHSRSRSPSRSRGRSRSRSQGSGDAYNPGNNSYVTGLPTQVTSTDLENHSSKEGKVSPAKEVRHDSRSVTPPPRQHRKSTSPSRLTCRRGSRSRGSGDAYNPGNNLYVTGLSGRVTSIDLEKHFSKQGNVVECNVVVDPRTGDSRGFAFVTMETMDDANKCLKYLDRTVLEGRIITVEKAKRIRRRTPTPGQYCGVRERRDVPSARCKVSYTPPRRHSRSRSRGRRRSRSPGSGDVYNPGNNLYVTGLSRRVTSTDLEKHFSKEGKVLECYVVVDPRTRDSRGFAFVTMETMDAANKCIKYLDRTVLEGRIITVEKAKRTRRRTPTPGQYCGVKGRRAAGDGDKRPRSRSSSPHRRHGRDGSRARYRSRSRSRSQPGRDSRRRRDRSRSRSQPGRDSRRRRDRSIPPKRKRRSD